MATLVRGAPSSWRGHPLARTTSALRRPGSASTWTYGPDAWPQRIRSAPATAGRASAAATEEAGLTSGGEFALDGLVRAFVGAGGRMVVASHWPVPDDYKATERLISGLFTEPPGTGTAGALRRAQRALMDEAATSHPYYWSGFAVVGDGAAPVIRAGS